jgi:hypothetical protein
MNSHTTYRMEIKYTLNGSDAAALLQVTVPFAGTEPATYARVSDATCAWVREQGGSHPCITEAKEVSPAFGEATVVVLRYGVSVAPSPAPITTIEFTMPRDANKADAVCQAMKVAGWVCAGWVTVDKVQFETTSTSKPAPYAALKHYGVQKVRVVAEITL